jgi:uroporphyrinogen-III decarboxylase
MLSAKENLLRAIRRDGPEWVPSALEAQAFLGPPVFERCWAAGCDDFGVRWAFEARAEGGTFPAPGGHPIRDLSRWREQLVIPEIDAMDWDAIAARAAEIDRDRYLVCGFVEMGLFERSYLLLGMDEALMAYVAEPDLMDELLGALAEYKIRLIERFDDVAQLDLGWYGDDWGTQDRLFLRPEVWRQIIRPHTQRIYDAMKRRGILVNQHSCGKIEAIFQDVVEMGADIWNPCQPCNDLAALKREFGGRIAFCGGIDSQFVLNRPGATPEEVRVEVRKRIDDLAAGGGYIAAPSHSVPTDPALVDAMNDEIASYGRRFYERPPGQ